MTSEIGFAIPYYRGVEYLKVAVESVLAQTIDGWELIVCDDSGEENEVAALLAGYDDPRITYHRNPENLGMVANWNLGLDLAASDLVNLLHADDALHPHYAATMCELAARHPESAAFFCETTIIDAGGHETFSFADSIKKFLIPGGLRGAARDGDLVLQGEEALASLMAGYFIMTPTICYRKSRLGERRFSAEWKQVQDLIFMTNLLFDGECVVGTPERAYAYRRHEESATAVQSESMLRFDEEFRSFDLIAARAGAQGWHEAARVAREKRIVKLHLGYRALLDLVRLRPSASLASLRFLAARR